MLNFEACAADQFGTNLHDIDIDSFLHFVADNVDHNSDTIDVLNTFHVPWYWYYCLRNKRKKVFITSSQKNYYTKQ